MILDAALVARAAAAVRGADALLFTAGAGMGVDSGLPDFRGPGGFWRAYPAYAHLGLKFEDLAAPHWFDRDPSLAWGFYGHRLNLYRATTPHAGFDVLLRWAGRARDGAFVFTSNVDGQFQRAGFPEDRIVECHGAIRTLQCLKGCGLFDDDGVAVDVDEQTFRARPPFPSCPRCGALLRPNVLMFSDFGWDDARTNAQSARFDAWLDGLRARGSKLCVVECGAGTALPTVRRVGERLTARFGATLVRVDPREAATPDGGVGLPAGALAALTSVDRAL